MDMYVHVVTHVYMCSGSASVLDMYMYVLYQCTVVHSTLSWTYFANDKSAVFVSMISTSVVLLCCTGSEVR